MKQFTFILVKSGFFSELCKDGVKVLRAVGQLFLKVGEGSIVHGVRGNTGVQAVTSLNNQA